MPKRSKRSKIEPWALTCSLAARAVERLGVDPAVVLEPLGPFERAPVDHEWAEVEAAAKMRGGDQHLLEAVGDAMQGADDHARTILAYCQTPGFVAEYLLDHVVETALEHYGPWNVGSDKRQVPDEGRLHHDDQRIRLLDPSCGSGHLLIRGARRLARGLAALRGLVAGPVDMWDALERVTGYELNPQAAALARCRLAAEVLSCVPQSRSEAQLRNRALERALAPVNGAVQVRDSLLDPGADRFEMIAANPPYVVCKDEVAREAIRTKYQSAMGKYGLHGPFLEAMNDHWVMPGGFVCAIVGLNFCKREWGKTLIEEVMPRIDLRAVVNSSGAFIPGHGTPTLILCFRGPGDLQVDREIFGVLKIAGEPTHPDNPADGVVWKSILGTRGGTISAMRGVKPPAPIPGVDGVVRS